MVIIRMTRSSGAPWKTPSFTSIALRHFSMTGYPRVDASAWCTAEGFCPALDDGPRLAGREDERCPHAADRRLRDRPDRPMWTVGTSRHVAVRIQHHQRVNRTEFSNCEAVYGRLPGRNDRCASIQPEHCGCGDVARCGCRPCASRCGARRRMEFYRGLFRQRGTTLAPASFLQHSRNRRSSPGENHDGRRQFRCLP
jgi:hypothetical protein